MKIDSYCSSIDIIVKILYELAHRMRPVVVALLVIAGTGGRAAAGRRWNRGAAARGAGDQH